MTGPASPAAPTFPVPPLELPLGELLARLGGERELLVTLAEIQKAESPRALQEIEGFLHAGDAQRLERAAHRLVGSLIVFGADEAAEAARSLERLSRERHLADAPRQFARLSFEIQRVLAALDRVLYPTRS
jgi:HPt (histidine-containing phosphotransfer) domain-containing protein